MSRQVATSHFHKSKTLDNKYVRDVCIFSFLGFDLSPFNPLPFRPGENGGKGKRRKEFFWTLLFWL